MPAGAGAFRGMRAQSFSPSLHQLHLKWKINQVQKCQPGVSSHLFFLVENRSESHSSRSPAAERNEATLVTGPEEERSVMQT